MAAKATEECLVLMYFRWSFWNLTCEHLQVVHEDHSELTSEVAINERFIYFQSQEINVPGTG